jgi:MFS family permease
VFDELGLVSIYTSALDVKLLCIQRFVRLFAYGASTLVLALYLSALGNSDRKIGLFMTLTLVGDILISFFLTLFADAMGRKMVLAAGALLMTGSGATFGLSGNYWVLLAAAVVGVISPRYVRWLMLLERMTSLTASSGNEIGPFRAIEESMLAHLTEPAVRSDIFAWYSLIGTAGAACGMMTSGWVVHSLQASRWSDIQAFRLIFFLYAVIGLVKFFLACMLSSKVEAEAKKPQPVRDTETAPLLDNSNLESPRKQKKSWLGRLPEISGESRVIIVNLCLLFALDSFASGLASL